MVLDFPITLECNNKCINCPIGVSVQEKFNSVKRTAYRLINTRKFKKIYITGGEPTIDSNFFTILRYIQNKQKESEICILSNGRQFSDRKFLHNFRNNNIDLQRLSLAIALYSHTSTIHERITSIQKSFKETVKGIENVISFHLPLEIRVPILRQNHKLLWEIANFIVSHFGIIPRVGFIGLDYTGRAKQNEKHISIKYADINMFLENAVEFFIAQRVNINIYNFPLCNLNEKYWALVIKENNSKGLFFSTSCNKCRYNRLCCGVPTGYSIDSKELTSIQVNLNLKHKSNDSQPIKTSNSFFNFLPSYNYFDKFPQLNLYLPDILAVKANLKPLARIYCRNSYEFYFLRKKLHSYGIYTVANRYMALEKESLHLAPIDPKNKISTSHNNFYRGNIYLYISKNKDILELCRNIDPEMPVRKITKNDFYKFSLTLGYPKCCIDNYLNKSKNKLIESLYNHKIKPFMFNNFLHSLSNYYLSFNLPCSYNCHESFYHNSNIFKSIYGFNKYYAYRMRKFLTNPILILFNLSNPEFFFEDRMIILFDEAKLINKNEISYQKYRILYTRFLYHGPMFDLKNSLSFLSDSNRLVIKNNYIYNYKNTRLINKSKIPQNYWMTLWKFN